MQSVVQLNPIERDGFTARNSMVGAADRLRKRVILFGGIDSEHQEFFSDLFSYDLESH